MHIGNLFCSGRGSCLALLAAGHAGGLHVHRVQVSAPAGLRALGVQSRVELVLFAGSLSSELEPSRSMETPSVILIFFTVVSRCCCFSEVPQQPLKAR